MTWYWYVGKPNEIILDLDSGPAITRALSVLRRAVSPNKALNKLDVLSVLLFPSVKPKHAHLIVTLHSDLDFLSRVSWSLWMGSDQIRAAYVMERARWLAGEKPGCSCLPTDLLVAREPHWSWRAPDDECQCRNKHKAKFVTDKCPALKRILGDHRSDDYFPRNKDRVRRPPVRFAWGRIPLTNLRAWRGNAGEQTGLF